MAGCSRLRSRSPASPFPAAWYIEGPQKIGGSVVLTNNQASMTVDADTIKHDLACYGNAQAPDTFDN